MLTLEVGVGELVVLVAGCVLCVTACVWGIESCVIPGCRCEHRNYRKARAPPELTPVVHRYIHHVPSSSQGTRKGSGRGSGTTRAAPQNTRASNNPGA